MRVDYNKQKLSTILRRWLVFILVIMIAAVAVVSLLVQNYIQKRQSFSTMQVFLQDYVKEIDLEFEIFRYFDRWMQSAIDGEETEGKEAFFDNARLEKIAETNQLLMSEVSIVDENGVVTYSSNPGLIGADLKDDPHLSAYLSLLGEKDSFADPLNTDPFNETTDMAYIGRAFRDKSGFVLFGLNEDAYMAWWSRAIAMATGTTRIGITGYLINCAPDKWINAVTRTMADEVGDYFPDESLLPENVGELKESIAVLYGEKSYVSAMKEPDYYIIGVYPVKEADQFQWQNNTMMLVFFLVILTAFFCVLFLQMKKIVLNDVERVHTGIRRIEDGDLDTKVDAAGSSEFVELSNGINGTVDKVRDLIEKEKERAEIEMENARSIQISAVPGTFPAFPDHTEFGIYASMDTAEAVGGDFYDFFLKDENTLVIVMADVSGKGMPAALYMMRAKTLIRTYAEQGLPVEEVAAQTNRKLCEDESAAMFVTAWIGFLDLKTGALDFVHAGHTYPVLIRRAPEEPAEETVTFVEKEVDMVLGGLDDMDYLRQQITLQHGDSLYLYTDGVTEAMDTEDHTYDEERLIKLIRAKATSLSGDDKNDFCKAACEMVYDDVKRFSAGAMQHDDITMMWVEY